MVKSAAVRGRPRSRDAAGLPAVTPEKIINSAIDLTARHGLDGWTLRQLAGALDAYPAVVYHHVGDREAVVAAVAERVIELLPVPEEDLPWREWFRALLTDLRSVLTGYPGVARRLALYEATSSAASTLVDRGVRTLGAAGFGEEAPTVFRLLLNTACLFVSAEDEQRRNVESKNSSPFDQLSDRPRQSNYFADFYDYAVERCLDGVACRLAVLQGRQLPD
ncbi:TetR/AcrR family transcriptional regulator [Amycolatopsis taiwanensis]|uniref:TetR family transcriptional regulator n=1 Tax=Amycolatopsis taiwanensis TaxID=342230 RepID=A0A9W6VGH3_9PSEU|nr:TetR/AcrR family transcriptional regulator [Amycolatopsis taiwanensis]GLY65964.1 TetR family transcriptional regulator [Amycolatopsis taiwanensis]